MKADPFYNKYLDSGIDSRYPILARFLCGKYGLQDNSSLFYFLSAVFLLLERGHLRLNIDTVKEELEKLKFTASDKEREALELLINSIDDPRRIIRENISLFISDKESDRGVRSPFVLLENGSFLSTEKLYREEKRFITAFKKHLMPEKASEIKSGSKKEKGIYSVIASIENRTQIIFEEKQKQAILKTFEWPLSVIAGGPGTGKTTVITAVIEAHLSIDPSISGLIALAAPTGRAAQRLEVALGSNPAYSVMEKPKTMHRLLGIGYKKKSAVRQAILPYHLIVIDESSMLDLGIMNILLSSLRENCRLVLVGDPQQLPSVGAGTVFSDIMESVDDERHILHERYIRLDTVKRSKGEIPVFAENIRQGKLILPEEKSSLKDDAFGNAEGKEAGSAVFLMRPELDTVLNLAALKYKKLREYAEQDDIALLPDFLSQFVLLSPHNYGQWGTDNLNKKISERLSAGERGFYPGMPVMILRNDYQNDLYNGDRGIIIFENSIFHAIFRDNHGRIRKVPAAMLKDWEVSYAQTIHKSQGNEYDTAAVILDKSAEKMLTNEILYTAVTRAKKEVLIFGEKEIIEAALKKKVVRCSGIDRSMIKSTTGLPEGK